MHLAGKRGVITEVHSSRYTHTLDKYGIRLDDEPEEKMLWDIEVEHED
jgi:hypothetical protein